MRKLLILLALFLPDSFSQIQPAVPAFLISGNDNSPSTFIQNSPSLSATNNNNFVVSWSDYRDGVPIIYSQKFDEQGNKIGENFKGDPYSNVYTNKKGYSLILNEETVSFFEDSYLYITAVLYNNLNVEINRQQIFSAYLPWCGTGFIPGEIIVISSDDCFYFLTNFSGHIALVKIENNGNIKTFNSFENLFNITKITSAVTSSPEGCNYFFAWINGNKDDSLETGLYGTFINSEDSLIVSHLPITQLADSIGLWEYVGNYNLKSIALNDSTYKLFWLNNASLMLYSIKLNIKGEIISDIDSLQVPNSNSEYAGAHNVIMTDKTEEGFYLYVSSSYYNSGTNSDEFTNSFIKYNLEGQRQGDIITEESGTFFNYLFNIGSGNFFTPSSDGKDVYLDKLEFFNLVEKQKINDDRSGSNERNQRVIKYDDNTVFAIWNDEEKSYGIKLNKSGNIIDEQIVLDNSDIHFFPDQEIIDTWISKVNDSTYNAGYTIYNKNFNEKFNKILFTTNSSYNLRIQPRIISDSTFIMLINNNAELRLLKESKSGNTIKETVITAASGIYGENIFIDDLNLPPDPSGYLWISWGNNIRKYSFDLEPLSEITTHPYFNFNNYVGDNKFLMILGEYDLFSNVVAMGTIINSDMDTIRNNIYLAYFKSGTYNLSVDRVDKNEFLVISKYSNKYYGRSFSNDGVASKDSFLINRNSGSYTSDLNFVVNGDRVFFTWSDTRRAGNGYDIYGNIFDLSSITSVREITSEIPGSFYLYQNYPNPFNPSTKIRFSVSEFSHIIIKIYDVLGNEITTLADEDKPSGMYEVDFSASGGGSGLSSGIYFYRIQAGGYSEVKKMILIK